ncbi:DegT/DnrJ/EryC1/StrS family aminotransferase [Aestuariirhabdus sp. LZHN29]|uniref:DegT/DnrJ/EryC1/StrS family aminotransferase n=1 Tax=Aestuariirhabdus sp. LZHN29 TaxID=3417462 RepID=UPI003CED7C08
MIPVTKPFLPNKEKLKSYIDGIYDRGILTNYGPLVQELERRLQDRFDVDHVILVANGSMALQVVYKVLELEGEVVTTPFSFVATTSTMVWGGLKPVFADIDPATFNIDPDNIDSIISNRTSAIVPVHVFGNPCNVEAIESIAKKYQLKTIYDASHAFDVVYKGKSIFGCGDVSTISFHATKLFHTIEGGAIVTRDAALAKKIRLATNFGFTGPGKIDALGINAKMNEFEAAMGLCVLDEVDHIANARKCIVETYELALEGKVGFQRFQAETKKNFSYAPVLFSNSDRVFEVEQRLNESGIYPRRYFYPSLDCLSYLPGSPSCTVSRELSEKILCLPVYVGLTDGEQAKIIKIIEDAL